MCRAQGFSPEAVPSQLARKKEAGRTGQLDSSEVGVADDNDRRSVSRVCGSARQQRLGRTGVAERHWLRTVSPWSRW